MSRESLWTRPEPGTRKPGHSREAIAAAAVAIADEEGIEAVSMRKVAARLGAGTMTLYHYVGGKDDLWALVSNAMLGELLVPDGELPTDDWRAAVKAIAHRTKGIFDRHPWALRSMFDGAEGAEFGPNAMRHFEQSMAAVSSLPLPAEERVEIVGLVDEYVWGYVFANAHEAAEAESPGFMERMAAYLGEQLASGEFPHTQALLREGEAPADALARVMAASRDPARFERGLDRLLDGIEAGL